MEDKKGFSLRQKKPSRRPTISAPKQVSNQSGPAPPKNQGHPRVNALSEKPQNVREDRPGRPGGNTADLVKRRYSTRFAQLPDFNNADVPPVPNGLPQQASKLNYPVPSQPQNLNVDISVLKNPELDAQNCKCCQRPPCCSYSNILATIDSSTVLADASDQQLRDFQESLKKLKNRASIDLQQNVYQNRTYFIKISKEAEKLSEEMRALRSLMSELNTSVNNLSSSASMPDPRAAFDDAATRARKLANRSSVANLEVMRNVELQALWKNVVGSQKFLPAIPGRHIVLEQASWSELDAATWKPKRQAHIVLLNDHLMIATMKKRRLDPAKIVNGETEPKAATMLVAEKCWPLQDIDMLDLASMANARDRHEMTNAISIRCGHESFTYRSDRQTSADKNNLLLSFRKTSEELRQVGRADTDDSTKRKEAMKYHATRDPTLSNKTDLLRSLSNSRDRPEVLIDVDGKQQNLRWVEGQIDELDIDIALQRFEDAVRVVEKLRKLAKGLKGNSIAQELIVTKVDGRANKLAGSCQ